MVKINGNKSMYLKCLLVFFDKLIYGTRNNKILNFLSILKLRHKT